MKILCLVTDAFGGAGGIAKFNRDLICSLSTFSRNCSIVVIPRSVSFSYDRLNENINYITSGVSGKIKYVLVAIRSALFSRFEYIVCGHINLLPVAFAIRLFTRTNIVLIVHGVDVWKPTKSYVTNYLVKKVYAIISVSKVTATRMADWADISNVKLYTLPNSVDLSKFTAGPKSKSLVNGYGLHNKFVILTLARLSASEKYKGIEEVLRVLPGIVANYPDLIYMIAGDGTDRERLTRIVSELNLQNNVIFTGYIPESEKIDYYRTADAFVMPGYGEGFGIVYLEALATGLPVLGSKIDGSYEALMEGKLGLVVNPHDQLELKQSILEILRKKKCVPDEISYFSFENYQKRVHKILSDFSGEE